MSQLNAAMQAVEMPARIAVLPVNDKGFPVPWFVATIDGKPDFRVIRPQGHVTAMKHRKCWICGQRLGQYFAFTIGPMCTINRISSEPPAHYECAKFAVLACPFLVNPAMRRNEKNLPGEAQQPPGEMIKRNPGAIAIWVTKGFKLTQERLIRVGDAERVEWWREGRPATLAEVEESVATGMHFLEDAARRNGDKGLEALKRDLLQARKFFPAAA